MADLTPGRCDQDRFGEDLRTWLTVIRGRAQLLLHRARGAADPDRQLIASLTAIDAAVTGIGERLARFEAGDAGSRLDDRETGDRETAIADS